MILGFECNGMQTNDGTIYWFTKKMPYPDGINSENISMNGVILGIESESINSIATLIEYGDFKFEIPNL